MKTEIRKAMILAAGKGTRLGSLTSNTPKALVEINGKTLLEIVLQRLIHFGYSEFIINVHHYSDQIIEFLKQHQNFGQRIEISDETQQLLDTGGGLQKAAHFFDNGQPFLVHNVDIITDLNLDNLAQAHLASGAKASLAVRARETSRYFLFDADVHLKGWTNLKTAEVKPEGLFTKGLTPLAFSGIQIIEPTLLQTMQAKGAFSLTSWYLELCNTFTIQGYVHNTGYWNDVGKPEELKAAADYLMHTSTNTNTL